MTNEEKRQAATAAREALIDRIFDLSLELTVERLETVEAKDKKDSMVFDRVARTAQVLVRLASEADGLAARKRKEQSENDQSGDDADEEKRLDREAAELQRRLDRYIDGLQRGDAAGGRRVDDAQDGGSRGDRA